MSADADGPRDAESREIANITLHAKWNHQAATLRAIVKAHCYTDRHLSVIITHIHGIRPKLHLVDLLLFHVYTRIFTYWRRWRRWDHSSIHRTTARSTRGQCERRTKLDGFLPRPPEPVGWWPAAGDAVVEALWAGSRWPPSVQVAPKVGAAAGSSHLAAAGAADPAV